MLFALCFFINGLSVAWGRVVAMYAMSKCFLCLKPLIKNVDVMWNSIIIKGNYVKI